MLPLPSRREEFITDLDLGIAKKTYAVLDLHQDAPREHVTSFGPFRLFAARRQLEKDGAPVEVRSRAFDILLALVEHANKVVSRTDLIAKVWPNLTVSDGTLRVQISALRKTLGDGQSGARYIANVNGRGYCLVAPVIHSIDAAPVANRPPVDRCAELPADLTCMLGRDDAVRSIVAGLSSRRFVTIVGPGGIGKTTVAVSVGHRMHRAFDTVYFVDLGSLSDVSIVPSRLASALGVSVTSDNPVPAILTFLRDKRVLLILDSCEHLIETIASLAERIFKEAPKVHVLATSRESLKVEGEHIHRLAPLDVPPNDPSLTAAEALTFSAVRLFLERATAVETNFELSDANAPVVGAICRRLDGIALAIELAAGRVDAYGVNEIAAHLDSEFGMSWCGRRTALPRHQTLGATLDWSHNLLSEIERMILRRLAVFVGPFSFETVLLVAVGDDRGSNPRVADVIASLVAKSLITVDPDGSANRYRLLNTTRAYLLRKLIESGEEGEIRERHASLNDPTQRAAMLRELSHEHGRRWPRRRIALRAERIIHLPVKAEQAAR
jgi:predicted ATPase/DNA-binding winged helix-turn-helix (wHTH) protein